MRSLIWILLGIYGLIVWKYGDHSTWKDKHEEAVLERAGKK